MILAAGLGCAPSAWEEHHRLALDGSGTSIIRLSADLLPGAGEREATLVLREELSAAGVTIGRTRLRRRGQVEAEVTFASVTALCKAPLLHRDCSYRRTEDGGFDLSMNIEPRPAPRPGPGEDVEIRVRTEGRITAHNSDGPLQRGNVLSWGRPLDRFLGEGMLLQVRTDGTSVFAATTRIVLRSALIALGIVGIGLTLLVLEGRRRLKRKRGSPAPP